MIIGLMRPLGLNDASCELSLMLPQVCNTLGKDAFNLARRIARKVLQMFNSSLPDSQRPTVIDRSSMIAATNQQAVSRILAVQDTLDKVVDVRYVVSRLENFGQNMPSQQECGALIRIINIAHLLALIRK